MSFIDTVEGWLQKALGKTCAACGGPIWYYGSGVYGECMGERCRARQYAQGELTQERFRQMVAEEKAKVVPT